MCLMYKSCENFHNVSSMSIFWVIGVGYNRMVDVLFNFTVYLAHIYISCICTFIHTDYTAEKYALKKKKQASKRQTGKAMLLCR